MLPGARLCWSASRNGFCRRRSIAELSSEHGTIMKTLAHSSFFRVFDLLLGTTNRGQKASAWSHDGVSWERERHAFTGPKHGLSLEIVTLTRPGRDGWSLMVVKEYWWAGSDNDALKSVRWAKPVFGERRKIMEWFRRQDDLLQRELRRTASSRPISSDNHELPDG